jgi:hypothetical protein
MILSKEVEVTLVNNIKYWEDKGYEIPRLKNKFGRLVFKRGTKIVVKVEDLPPKSNIKVWCKCDGCGREKEVEFLDYHDLCTMCFNKTKQHRKRVSDTLTGKYKGKNSPSWTGGLPKCEDCGKQITNRKAKLCNQCRGKRNRGENNPNWKTKSKCLDCGKILSTRKSKYCRQCFGKHQTGEDHPTWNFNKTEFRKYWTLVWRETRKYKKKLFELWNGKDHYTGEFLITNDKSFNDKRYRTIDHKTSISYGFKNNINPKEIGKIDNLCICSRSTNSKKHDLLENEFASIINNNG